MIIFCVDGNAEIGLGHVMRCLAIADAAKELGEESLFVCASGEVKDLINNREYNCIIIDTDYRNLRAEEIIPIIEKYARCLLITDSYYVTKEYLEDLKSFCKLNGGKLVYIDDVKAFSYPCDILINYQIHASIEEYDNLYLGETKPEYCVGTEYVPLRKQFTNIKTRNVHKEAKNILVSTGGADTGHMMIEIIRQAKKSNKVYHMVVGSMNNDKTLIYDEAKEIPNIVLYEGIDNMSELMQLCDVAISAAGTTVYELCATQTPTVLYVVADNQVQIAESLSLRGIMTSCGNIECLGAKEMAKSLIEKAVGLCEDYEERVRLSHNMRRLIDGNGAKRIIEKILFVLKRKEVQ